MRSTVAAGLICLAGACVSEPGPPDVASGMGGSGASAGAGATDGDGSAGMGGSASGGYAGYSGNPGEGGIDPFPEVTLATGWNISFVDAPTALTCAATLASAKAAGAPFLAFGSKTLVAGYEQVGQNQNPVVALFDGATQLWCARHEQDAPDGRAYGLSWDGGNTLYVVYTIAGGGSALDAAAQNGWLSSYGAGGGPKVTFVGKVDAASGALEAGSYLIAKKQDGQTNTFTPLDAPLPLDDGTLEVRGSSAFLPLNPDESPMTCTDYPFYVRYVLSLDLSTLECSTSTNCQPAKACP